MHATYRNYARASSRWSQSLRIGTLGVFLTLATSAVAQDHDPSTEVLIATLEGRDAQAAIEAAAQLGDRPEEAEQVVPALIAALMWQADPLGSQPRSAVSQEVAQAALAALHKIGKPAIAQLKTTLDQTESDELRVEVLLALRGIPQPGPGAEAALVRAMRHANADTRYHAMETLMSVAQRPSKYAIVLTRQLYDSDAENRNTAIRYLGEMGSAGQQAVPHMIEMLQDAPRRRQRSNYLALCQALSEMGEAARPAIAVLKEKMKDSDPRIQTSAALTIARIDPSDLMPIAKLSSMARDVADNKEGAYWAIRTLGEIGPEAKVAMPLLKELAASWSIPIRTSAIRAVVQIDPDDALPLLIELQDDRQHEIREAVLRAMGSYSPNVPEVANAVVEALDQPFTQIELIALENLRHWGPEAKHLATEVRQRLEAETNVHRRKALAEVLSKLEQIPPVDLE